VLAPNAPWRQSVVAREDGPPAESGNAASPPMGASDVPPPAARPLRMCARYRSWAELMRRAFDTDVLACPRCGGRMVLIATIEDPAVIRRILTHLGLSIDDGDP
jgi:hypothetical protein